LHTLQIRGRQGSRTRKTCQACTCRIDRSHRCFVSPARHTLCVIATHMHAGIRPTHSRHNNFILVTHNYGHIYMHAQTCCFHTRDVFHTPVWKTNSCTQVIYVFSFPTERSVCVLTDPPHTVRERSSTKEMKTLIDWAWKPD
jgi:hypothetical protein